MAQYFNYFTKIPYIVEESSGLDLLTNIITRIKFLDEVKDVASAYFLFDNVYGETPESLAYKFYGSTEKHWIILLYNDIIDPQFQWYKNYDVLNKYIDEKYKDYGNLKINRTNVFQNSIQRPITSLDLLESFFLGKIITNQSQTKRATVESVVTPTTGINQYTDPRLLIKQISGERFTEGETIVTEEANPFSAQIITKAYDINYAIETTGKYFIRSKRTITYPLEIPNTVTEVSEIDRYTYEEYLTESDIFNSELYLFTNDTDIQLTDVNGVQYTLDYNYDTYTQTFYEYEIEQNEKLRYIKMLKSEYLPRVENEFKKLAALNL